MAKQLHRTIIVTIVETWTLTWVEPEGKTKDIQIDEICPDYTPLHRRYWRPSTAVGAVIVSSSRITTVLPEPLTSENGKR